MQAWSIWKWSLKPVCNQKSSLLITDGRPLSLEEVWSNVHPNYRPRLQQGPWDTLTQQVACVTSCIYWSVFMLFLCPSSQSCRWNAHKLPKCFIDCRRRIALLQEAVAFSKSMRLVGFAVPKIQDAQVLIGPSGYKMVYKVPEVLISHIYIFKENNI